MKTAHGYDCFVVPCMVMQVTRINLRFGSTTNLLAKRMLKYYRTSECGICMLFSWLVVIQMQEGLLLWQLGPSELTAQPVHTDHPRVLPCITAMQCPAAGTVLLLTEAEDLWQLTGLPALLSLQDPASSTVWPYLNTMKNNLRYNSIMSISI